MSDIFAWLFGVVPVERFWIYLIMALSLLAAAAQSGAGGKARRITSAPKDGRQILVYDGLWFVVRWREVGGRYGFFSHDDMEVAWATAWARLPRHLGRKPYIPKGYPA